MENILEMRNIMKTFQSFVANDHVNFSVRRGEIHTLLGENGAGKSTLMNILSGLYAADSGEIVFNGNPVKIKSPKVSVGLGIGMVHQHFQLIQAMDVIDNIILGMRSKRYPLLDREKAEKDIVSLSQNFSLNINPRIKVEDLSVGAQQRTEIIKILFHKAELLILDEPTAVLTPEECKGLFRVLEKLKHEGKTIIFISHKLNEVMEISDRITILRKGKLVATINKTKTSKVELAQLMVGQKIRERKIEKNKRIGKTVFEAKGIHLSHNNIEMKDLHLLVHSGEILGIAGVDGNGQSELALLASGMLPPDHGELWLSGTKMEQINAHSFYKKNVAHIPGDRNRFGLIGDMTIEENMFLKNIGESPASRWNGWKIDYYFTKKQATEWQKKFDIRATSIESKAKNLSGGNQQKVILARELSQHPVFLIAVHPTRGLDIGAIDFVHHELIRAKDAGCGILLISADLDEVLLLSDRIKVIYEGRIMGNESGDHPDIDRIGLLMAGHERGGL